MGTGPHWDYEQRYWQEGYRYIAGVDEVGRGAWAGPVVAGAVVLPPAPQMQKAKIKTQILGRIKDSKLLTPKIREELAPVIKKTSIGWAIGMASVAEIDQLGIHSATFLACKRAISQLETVDFLLIDAYKWPDSPLPYHNIVKGDNISFSIAAASIVAKVARDKMMVELHNRCASYGFDLHKGYGTKLHRERLAQYGISEHHRRSFRPVGKIAAIFTNG